MDIISTIEDLHSVSFSAVLNKLFLRIDIDKVAWMCLNRHFADLIIQIQTRPGTHPQLFWLFHPA